MNKKNGSNRVLFTWRPQAKSCVIQEVGQKPDVLPGFATDFNAVKNPWVTILFRVRDIDELFMNLLLKVVRKAGRKFILDHIHMSTHNDHWTVRSSGLE